MNNRQKLNALGLQIPDILLPLAARNSQRQSDLAKWPVIACDQFTQDRGYWEKVKAAADGSPSTLNLILPEVFLNDDNAARRITDIHSNMKRYLKDDVFAPLRQGFIYIERDTPYQKKRRGLIAAIDLEKYDWHPDARPLIRCTEGTVPERLPPRMDIRRGAPLELPHVLLLIDDETDRLLSTLGERVKNDTRGGPCYSTPLMMDSGHITGWFIDSEDDISFIAEKLDELRSRSVNRYAQTAPVDSLHPAGASHPSDVSYLSDTFLFAVGDGNHSLAAAKGIWDEYKNNTVNPRPDHPLRYALVEIENIYDPAIQFEPIHRLVFGIGFDGIISLLSNGTSSAKLPDFSCEYFDNRQNLSKAVFENGSGQSAGNCYGVISEGRYALIKTSASGIATSCLQPLLDEYLVDYIHDEDELSRLSDKNYKTAEESIDINNGERVCGILLPPVLKSGLFQTVARTGPLPRKSFSMGHSCEKRFYFECRSLF